MSLFMMPLAKLPGLAMFVAISLSLPDHVLANSDSIKIVSPILGERLLTQDKNGFWADMLRQILNDVDEPTDLVALPFKRALAGFASDDFDCIWSLDKKLLDELGVDVTSLIQSEIVFEATQHVFLAPGHPTISSLDDLSGKRVGIGSGSNYEEQLRKTSAKVVLLSDQVSKLRMLENDRIDAFVGWLPSLLIMDTDATLKSDLLRNHLKLSSSGAAFVCHDSVHNSEFNKKINAAILAYRTSEPFTALFEAYGASQMIENEYK